MKKVFTVLLVAVFFIPILTFGQTEAKVYPNPVRPQGQITLFFEDQSIVHTILLHTSNGKPLGKWENIVGFVVVLPPRLARGVYIIQIFTNKGIVSKKVFVS